MKAAGTKKDTQQQPLSSEELLADILDHSHDGIIILDREGTARFASRSAKRFFDYEMGDPPAFQEWASHAFPDPAERDQVAEQWKNDVESDNPPEREFLVRRKNGEQRWCRLQIAKMRSGYIIVNLQDITERKIAEDRHRTLFAQAADSILLIDPETARVVDVNDAACKTFGYSSEEFKKLRIYDFEAVETHRQIMDHVKHIVAKGSDLFETKQRMKNGEVRDMQVNVRVVNIGEKPYLQAIFRDITERKRTEAVLKESEESFRNLAEQSPNMIFINSGKRIAFANRQCEKILGYSCKELYAPDFNYMTLIAPDCRGLILKAARKHKKGEEVAPYEYALITKGGERMEAILATKLIKYGGQVSILGIVTDISKFKRIETELRQSQALLMEQKKALQEKNVALKEILAHMESERLQIRSEIATNVENIVMPIVTKLKKARSQDQTQYLKLLENGLSGVTSRFGLRISKNMADLSPRQIEICNMIKNGMTSKEIADLLHVSLRTVETQRNRIRKKFGILNQAANLASFLNTLE